MPLNHIDRLLVNVTSLEDIIEQDVVRVGRTNANNTIYPYPNESLENFNIVGQMDSSQIQTGTIASIGDHINRLNRSIPDRSYDPRRDPRDELNINYRDELDEYIEEYIRNRNAENTIFINYNTSLKEIEYNDINDLVEFRIRLDNKIKEHFTREE